MPHSLRRGGFRYWLASLQATTCGVEVNLHGRGDAMRVGPKAPGATVPTVASTTTWRVAVDHEPDLRRAALPARESV
jgi:hypothetical protein